MEMYFEQVQTPEQRQEQRVSPTLIAFTQLLVLSTYGLEQAIQQELSENPALELVEQGDRCVRCGERLIAAICPRCHGLGDDDWQPVVPSQEDPDEERSLTWIAANPSLSEVLRCELYLSVPTEDYEIVDYLCGSLDERGFLATTVVAEVAEALGVEAERVEWVLTLLQQSGPAGVGARSVQECLELQLCRWEALGEAPAIVRPIVTSHLEALGKRKYYAIAAELGVTYDEVIAARDFIRNHLRPLPLMHVDESQPWHAATRTPF
ncbi:MAG: hypothetical protein M3220_05305, partial [Chloroflexota bacterium]|nr:hypothetical protein [Chloroflexota bacterium]